VVAQVATLIALVLPVERQQPFHIHQLVVLVGTMLGMVALAVQEAVLHLFKRQVFMEEQMAAQDQI
jgi:hypothetical protein